MERNISRHTEWKIENYPKQQTQIRIGVGKRRRQNRGNDLEMENPDTSERNGYKPISSNPEDELKLHTEGEMPTGENENKSLETENPSNRRSNRKCMQPSLYGGVLYTKNFWI